MRRMRADAIGVAVLMMLAGACAATDDPKTRLRAVTLPDLSRLEESVQVQLRERYETLSAKQNDRASRAADLGTEYGEMGVLLMAAGLNDSAEAALLNAQTLARDDMRWPYYLGHLHRARGDIPNATAAFERASFGASPGGK